MVDIWERNKIRDTNVKCNVTTLYVKRPCHRSTFMLQLTSKRSKQIFSKTKNLNTNFLHSLFSICPSRAVYWLKLGVSTSGRRSCVMLCKSTAPHTRRGAVWARPCSLGTPARPQTASWQPWIWRLPAPSGPSPSSPGSSEGSALWWKFGLKEAACCWIIIHWCWYIFKKGWLAFVAGVWFRDLMPLSYLLYQV